MPSLTRPALVLPGLALCLTPALAACGNDASSGATRVAVSASDDACKVEQAELESGKHTFAVTNDGSKVTEVYVYGDAGGEFTKVVSEVENIGPGTSRDMTVTLGAGTYEIACKPGQRGDGIRQRISVTGEKKASEGDQGYDREIELTTTGADLTGLTPATADKGERVEFKLANKADESRTLEVIGPDGTVVAEFDVAAGAEGEDIVELTESGDWTIKLEGGAQGIEQTLAVS
jgi:iron uptake system component EfeO